MKTAKEIYNERIKKLEMYGIADWCKGDTLIVMDEYASQFFVPDNRDLIIEGTTLRDELIKFEDWSLDRREVVFEKDHAKMVVDEYLNSRK